MAFAPRAFRGGYGLSLRNLFAARNEGALKNDRHHRTAGAGFQ